MERDGRGVGIRTRKETSGCGDASSADAGGQCTP